MAASKGGHDEEELKLRHSLINVLTESAGQARHGHVPFEADS
jgi:hypothetical protein